MTLSRLKYGVAICTVALLVAMAGGVWASNIGETVKSACSTCHSTKRVCINLGVKNEADWKETVVRMVDEGAQLKGDQINAAVRYLSGLAPGSGSICQ